MAVVIKQIAYGFMGEKLSRKQTERFILLHNANQPNPAPIPQPPVSRFWCRPAGPDAPAPWIIGWTGPVIVRDQSPVSSERSVIVH